MVLFRGGDRVLVDWYLNASVVLIDLSDQRIDNSRYYARQWPFWFCHLCSEGTPLPFARMIAPASMIYESFARVVQRHCSATERHMFHGILDILRHK